MTADNEEVLRRSLKAVDRNRNLFLIGVVVMAALLVLGFVQATHAIETHNDTMLLHAVMLILGFWMSIMTLAIVIQVTMMTKRILRAIELASRK